MSWSFEGLQLQGQKMQTEGTMQLEDYFDFLSADDIRITGHRIGIDDVLDLYLEGYSPEEIVQYYGTLQPVEVYATITYYHQNRAEVDAYLARVRAWRDQHWQELAEREPPEVVKRLRALRAERAEARGTT
jgi:uncharacterized protein (DUF433 family)